MARPLRIEFLGEEDIFKQGIEQQGDPPTENLETPPDALIQAVSDEFGCGMESILRKGKKTNLARDVAIYLCREMTGETSVVLGRRFDISGAGIAARHDQIAKKLETDRKLKGREHRIRRSILIIEMRPQVSR